MEGRKDESQPASQFENALSSCNNFSFKSDLVDKLSIYTYTLYRYEGSDHKTTGSQSYCMGSNPPHFI